MFKKLVKKLFKPASKDAQPNLYFFEDSRPSVTQISGDYMSPVTQQPHVSQSIAKLQKTLVKPVVYSSNEEKYETEFYNFMFGKSANETTLEQDELSVLITKNIESLLANPKVILDALPILPMSLTTMVEQLNDKNFDTDSLVKLIQQEPVIAAKVLELANSALYSRGGKEVVDIQAASMRLGVKGLSEGVINGFISKLVPQSTIYFKLYGKRIWQHSLSSGVYAKQLIDMSERYDDSAQGYLIGLICNLGDVIIYQLLLEAFAEVDPGSRPDSRWFKQVMCKNSKKLTYFLAKFWNFPKSILDILAIQAKLKNTAQCKKLLEERPLACYIYEARIISELKLRSDGKDINEEELALAMSTLLFTDEAQTLCDQLFNELVDV